jgi:signal transduction histidine kinase
VAANWDAKKATLQIQDTDEGISEEVKVKFFKPLFTTKAKGQGLGLAVVKKLTDALNGKIGFQSIVRQGTKFTIEIPLQQRNYQNLRNV